MQSIAGQWDARGGRDGIAWTPENPTHVDRRSGKVHMYAEGRKGGVAVRSGAGGSQQPGAPTTVPFPRPNFALH